LGQGGIADQGSHHCRPRERGEVGAARSRRMRSGSMKSARRTGRRDRISAQYPVRDARPAGRGCIS
jgi:hypothetical protein